MKLAAVNEFGRRIGETHGRAKLSDHDVNLMVSLLEYRCELIERHEKAGASRREIERILHRAQMSYAGIAAKFEVSKSQVRWIDIGSQRSQRPARWKPL